MIDRKTLIERLTLIQRNFCAYDALGFSKHDRGPPDTCDCKFGMSEFTRGKAGEENGCPEMRQVVWLLERMTDEEYKEKLNI
jgi:hypothetical protein